jgi:hypothetical protein
MAAQDYTILSLKFFTLKLGTSSTSSRDAHQLMASASLLGGRSPILQAQHSKQQHS